MFNFLAGADENARDVEDIVLPGEEIAKRQVAKLASEGLSVEAIASETGLAVHVVEKLVGDVQRP